jgi:hypothetical protein
MGTVIDLSSWLERHDRVPAAPTEALDRLERAVARLDPLLQEVMRRGNDEQEIETELLAVTGALSVGFTDEAAHRAERLSRRLESRLRHPSNAGPGSR